MEVDFAALSEKEASYFSENLIWISAYIKIFKEDV